MMLKAYVAYLSVFSAITLILYAVDKARAIKGEWRIPEKTLLLCSLLGGGVGGYSSMFLFRHKIRKTKFHVIHILALAWQAALFIFLMRGGF